LLEQFHVLVGVWPAATAPPDSDHPDGLVAQAQRNRESLKRPEAVEQRPQLRLAARSPSFRSERALQGRLAAGQQVMHLPYCGRVPEHLARQHERLRVRMVQASDFQFVGITRQQVDDASIADVLGD
jgi:hypothetical protein